jgi:hypothetical protein
MKTVPEPNAELLSADDVHRDVAELTAARYPNMDAVQIKEHLRQTTTRLAIMKNRAWTPAYGTGLLNLKKALS